MTNDSFQSGPSGQKFERAAEARKRFVTLMKIMSVASVLTLIAALTWFHQTGTELRPSFVGAIVVTIVGSLILAGILMGLVFFSSATGIDDDSEDQDS